MNDRSNEQASERARQADNIRQYHTLHYVHLAQSRINHLVGPTHFTTLGPHWEARRRRRRGGGKWGGGVPLPSRLEGLGECRKLPQPDPGQSPGQKRILVKFELEKYI